MFGGTKLGTYMIQTWGPFKMFSISAGPQVCVVRQIKKVSKKHHTTSTVKSIFYVENLVWNFLS